MPLLTIKECGELVGKNQSAVRKWIKRYNMNVHKFNGLMYLDKVKVLEINGKIEEKKAIGISNAERKRIRQRAKLKKQSQYFTEKEKGEFRAIIREQQENKVQPLYVPSHIYTKTDFKKWQKQQRKK